jgi:hypothetical protein
MPQKLTVPTFATEEEEAQWWYDHRNELADAFESAAARGEVRSGSAARIARERAGETAEVVWLDAEDVSKARDLAAKRGIPYEIYLKTLLHEALELEKKRVSG